MKQKEKKSNKIIAINLSDHKCIICDSGKLFGDYVGKSKDYIKNCLRDPSKIKGYNLFYFDYEKRNEIIQKMYKKRSIRNKEFIIICNFLNDIQNESVETIYDLLNHKTWNIYELKYENVYDNKSLFLTDVKLPLVINVGKHEEENGTV